MENNNKNNKRFTLHLERFTYLYGSEYKKEKKEKFFQGYGITVTCTSKDTLPHLNGKE